MSKINFQKLSSQKIIRRMEKESFSRNLFAQNISVLDSTSSTNTLLKENFLHGKVIVSEEQTHGRATQGRVWVSPKYKNIYMSLALTMPSSLVGFLSLWIGLMVAESIAPICRRKLTLKWVNDIVIKLTDDNSGRFVMKKIGGILTETDIKGHIANCVIGVGLNVHGESIYDDSCQSSRENIGGDERNIFSSVSYIAEQPNSLDRNDIIAKILLHTSDNLPNFLDNGFSEFFLRWKEFELAFGQTIQLIKVGDMLTPDMFNEATYQGINKDGSLSILQNNKEKRIYDGEFSIRAI